MSDPEPARADDVQASPRGDGLTPLTEVCEGRYVLLAELARGDLSVVYRAKPKGSREAIAFKVLQPRLLGDEAQVRRFRREAEILRRIEHPNIVRLVDHGSIEDGRDFIALELLPGHTLADALAEGTRMEPERVCRICRQITRALRAMHQAGVIHRDLQPANIVLIGPEDGERVKLVDFSDAGDVGAPARRVRRSGKRRSTGNVLDVPSYRPPEQLRKRPPHPSMDIYALGVMMYEMLAGEHPFAQSDELAPPRMGPHTIRSKVFDAPEELLGLIVDCIEQSPEQRPVSTTAVLERLDKALLWIGVVPHDVEAEVGDEDARTQQWPAADPGKVRGAQKKVVPRDAVGTETTTARDADGVQARQEREPIRADATHRPSPEPSVTGAEQDPSIEDADDGSDEGPSTEGGDGDPTFEGDDSEPWSPTESDREGAERGAPTGPRFVVDTVAWTKQQPSAEGSKRPRKRKVVADQGPGASQRDSEPSVSVRTRSAEAERRRRPVPSQPAAAVQPQPRWLLPLLVAVLGMLAYAVWVVWTR